jgi:Tol biopolymer transport system component
VQGNDDSYSPSISADGRFVAFQSDATNLVPGDTNGSTDIFVHDRLTGKTERVSVSSSGVQGNSDSVTALITPDGRFVAFSSYSSNLAPHPTTSTTDTFVHDRLTGKTDMVSGGRGDRSSNGSSGPGGISANGRFVVFDSDGTNLVVGDTNNNDDVFVRDRQNGTTKRVNCTYRGESKQPNSVAIYDEGISSNGRFVVFSSAGPGRSRANVFVVNRVTGKTRLVSVARTTRLSQGIGRG